MNWEKSSADLVGLFSGLVPRDPDVQVKKMFGWPCCFVNGNLCAGLHKQSVIFRLPEEDLARFLKLKGASEFEPMPGRKMKGYGILSEPLDRERSLLEGWLGRSLAYARTLPTKEKKPTGKASTAKKKR